MDEEDRSALFEQSMLPHLDASYNLARWLTGNSHDAEDVVQEAYLRALRYFKGFAGGDGRAWMLKIVRNTSLTWNQGKKNPPVEFDERIHNSDADQSSPELHLLRSADKASLRDCMEALPPQYREAIVMRELEQLSYREISDISGLPIGTVMSRLARSRKRLMDCMTAKNVAKELVK